MLNNIVIIRDRIEAFLTKTFELYEYPIPRPFIVLFCLVQGILDAALGVFAEHHRAYSLCKCGSHTTPEDVENQHEIYFAKHEGYDLDRSTLFFERYVSYLITMLQIVPFRISAPGSVDHPLLPARSWSSSTWSRSFSTPWSTEP